MKQTAQKASTQQFTEILDIKEDIVLLHGGDACIILELQAVNFTLLSGQEQDSKVYGYAALLNSLSFPVQILMRSKRIDIMPYINSLSDAATRTTNVKLSDSISKYKDFVNQLVTTSVVLDKKFYMIISYSSLEEGFSGISKMVHLNESNKEDFFIRAKAALHTKAESLLSQTDRMAIRAKILEKDALVSLFHDIFNEEGNKAITHNPQIMSQTKGGIK
ncbi:MAG TPA: hypothetical protein VF189_04680 [Patescibacteria group bacterium]